MVQSINGCILSRWWIVHFGWVVFLPQFFKYTTFQWFHLNLMCIHFAYILHILCQYEKLVKCFLQVNDAFWRVFVLPFLLLVLYRFNLKWFFSLKIKRTLFVTRLFGKFFLRIFYLHLKSVALILGSILLSV